MVGTVPERYSMPKLGKKHNITQRWKKYRKQWNLVPRSLLDGNIFKRFNRETLNCLNKYEALMT